MHLVPVIAHSEKAHGKRPYTKRRRVPSRTGQLNGRRNAGTKALISWDKGSLPSPEATGSAPR
jgi:hypothetical protein